MRIDLSYWAISPSPSSLSQSSPSSSSYRWRVVTTGFASTGNFAFRKENNGSLNSAFIFAHCYLVSLSSPRHSLKRSNYRRSSVCVKEMDRHIRQRLNRVWLKILRSFASRELDCGRASGFRGRSPIGGRSHGERRVSGTCIHFFAHAAAISIRGLEIARQRVGFLVGSAAIVVIGVVLIALAPSCCLALAGARTKFNLVGKYQSSAFRHV
jgi:hypothetical protein